MINFKLWLRKDHEQYIVYWNSIYKSRMYSHCYRCMLLYMTSKSYSDAFYNSDFTNVIHMQLIGFQTIHFVIIRTDEIDENSILSAAMHKFDIQFLVAC